MPDGLRGRLRRFKTDASALYRARVRSLLDDVRRPPGPGPIFRRTAASTSTRRAVPALGD